MSSVVGRDSELRAVETFLASGECGHALAIFGEPGIGKTTVWQEAVALAGSRGPTVLEARPAESEAKLAFVGLADLLSSVPEELFALLPAPQRAGLDAALLRTTSTRSEVRRLVGTGFLSLLRRLARDAAAVLAIDDLHWLDAPSAAVVEFALRRLDREPVRAIVSLRSQEAEVTPLLTLERDAEPRRHVAGLGGRRHGVRLGRLERAGADEPGRRFPDSEDRSRRAGRSRRGLRTKAAPMSRSGSTRTTTRSRGTS